MRARDFDAEAWSTQGKSLMKHIALHIAAGPGGAERVRLFNRALELAPRFGGAQTPAAQIEMWLQAFVAEGEYHFAAQEIVAPATADRREAAPEAAEGGGATNARRREA